MVPVASWVRVWSMRIPISPPLFHSPSTRWASRIFRVRLLPMCPPRANKAYYARRIYRRAWLIIGRMPRRLSIAFLVLALCSGVEALGEDSSAPKGNWTFTNIEPYTYWLDSIVPSGASVDILYNGLRLIPGLDTILETDVGAGWQTNYFYRNPDGSPYTGPGEPPSSFDQAEFLDDIGIRQGLLRDGERKRDLLEVFLFYRLHYDRNFPTVGGEGSLLYASAFPDRQE